MNLTDIMQNTGLHPTQKYIYDETLQDYADAMQNGSWDWNKTANDPLAPMITDASGNIMAGHHRFIAAAKAGVKIPDGVVKIIPGVGARTARSWSDVTIVPGRR